ncbi:unnamed protein product [Cochlearia groenlandica]
MGRPKTRGLKKQMRLDQVEEIDLHNNWIDSQRPDSGSNPISLGPLLKDSKIGIIEESAAAVYSVTPKEPLCLTLCAVEIFSAPREPATTKR